MKFIVDFLLFSLLLQKYSLEYRTEIKKKNKIYSLELSVYMCVCVFI